MAEYQAHRMLKEKQSQARYEAERDRQQVLKQANRDRKKASATQNLWNAVRRGDSKAVEALLHKGADWRSVVAEKGSLLELAKIKANRSLIELLEQH